jgi:hypothetical protein
VTFSKELQLVSQAFQLEIQEASPLQTLPQYLKSNNKKTPGEKAEA